ncbi:MAG: AAA family ATPase [Chloroflexi bacterium]|nr:MAG: AAA family ATPase [Chloroflexota bacterium]
MGTKQTKQSKHSKENTPTFLLELPLEVEAGQARRLRSHLEAGRQFYNAVLSEGQRRLRRMKADPAWGAAQALPRTRPLERRAAFSALRQQYGFSDYAFQGFAKELRVSWLADHLDAVLAQTLATRAYRALNRVCVGQARRVRFKSRGRGLASLENKRNDTGLRFVLQTPEEGHAGYLVWHDDQLGALIDWNDPVVKHGLDQPIKYARLIRRPASSPRAQGADREGDRYFVQLALRGVPYQKPKHEVGKDTIGLDLGPASIAIVPREAEARLDLLCAELRPDEQAIRRLQRQMDRQRRAANPEHYDEQGRVKKRGKGAPRWKQSRGYQATRRRKASRERRLSAHRKSLHGRLVHQIVSVGNTILTEKISYQGWQKQYGRSVGLRAPGMLIAHLRRTVASTGGTLIEVPTRSTKLSQYCHGCGQTVRKPLSQRWHQCPCGIGPVQRDLYSAFLAAYLDPAEPIPSCAQYVVPWEGAEARLRAAHERVKERANEGQVVPRSMGIPRAGARLPQSRSEATPELLFLSRRGNVEAWKHRPEPPVL